MVNISLSKGKKKLGFGLNTRKEGETTTTTSTSNVFGGDESDSDDNEEQGDDRAAVNRNLRAEQEALRKRAAASLEEAQVYDYDGAYDDMHAASNKPKEPEEKKARYIGDLLKAAKHRERERDVIHERKVAKEQAQEEAEYQGKDKFVTKAYKQKLAERELWAQEEEAKRQQEEKDDVTKKKVDGAFSSFYGNLNRNVAMGGAGDESKKEGEIDEDVGPSSDEAKPASGLGFLDGFERSAPHNEASPPVDTSKSDEAVVEAPSPVSMRKAREEKLAKARLRYFQRHGISEESAIPQKQ